MCACGTARPPRGAALIIAMLVMAVLLLAGTTFLTISSTESQIALNERASIQALHLAEAAIHKAIAQLDNNASYPGETNTSLGGGTFRVTATTTTGCSPTSARLLDATASVPIRGGFAQARIQVTVDQVSYPFRWAVFSTVPGVVGGQQLQMTENSQTDSFDSSLGNYNTAIGVTVNKASFGSIGANSNISVENGAYIWGGAAAAGAITTSAATITGPQLPGFTPGSFPSITAPTTAITPLTAAQYGLGNNGTLTLTAGRYSAPSLTFGNNATLVTTGASISNPVAIYVTGDVNLGNTVTLGGPPGAASLQIIMNGSVSTGNNAVIYASLYGVNADVTLGNNTQVYGSVIARTFNSGNTSSIHYDEALYNQKVCTDPGGKYAIVRGTWREVIP